MLAAVAQLVIIQYARYNPGSLLIDSSRCLFDVKSESWRQAKEVQSVSLLL